MSITNEEEQFKKLSHDLLVYLSHLEETYVEIEESEEKVIIDEWLQWILKNPNGDLDAARIRNMALSKMLMDIGSDKLLFPFNERPSDRSYTELVECLKTVLNQNALLENEEHDETLYDKPENRELDLSEFGNIISNDTRTYIALRTLPNSGGVFGYVAITMGDGPDTQWLDSKGQPIPTPVPGNLRVEQIKKDSEEEKDDCEQSDAKLVWNVLQDRRALCLRIDSFEFYKNLYNNVEQEMLAEKNNRKCSDPFINKLLKFLEIDLKAIGITDLKTFCRIKMLSILKKQIKSVISEIKRRTETLSNAEKCSTMSPIFSLPAKCCYNFVSSTLWNEIYKQQPAKKYMDILSNEYPKYFFPKYFSALLYQKKQILSSISRKYCNIMDEMFADLGNSISSDMKSYRDSKWEWHLAHEIIDAYKKEKAFKDSLCVVKNSADEMTDPFLAVILNEIEMAQDKLRSLVMKNDKLAAQLPELRNEISDVKRAYQTIVAQNEEKICKLSQEINNEKRDIIKRTNTIAELEQRVKELNK